MDNNVNPTPSFPTPGDSGTTVGAQTPKAPEMLRRVVEGAHHTIDKVADTAAPHVQRLQQGMEGANEVLHTRAEQLRTTGDEWTENLRTTVRANPLTAVATALAVGMILARLNR